MSFFKRMKEMALAAATGDIITPQKGDEEANFALHSLEAIWEEMTAHINNAREPGTPLLLPKEVQSFEYLPDVIDRINKDEALAFDGWQLGEGAVSVVKQFSSHAEMIRARDIFAVIDGYAGKVTGNVPLVPSEAAFSNELTDTALAGDIYKRQNSAKKLSMRRDWMEAFAEKEEKVGCLPSR